MQIVRTAPCEASFHPLTGPLSGNRALCSITQVALKGAREAYGRAVVIDPRKCSVKLFVDEGMLSYDFSRYATVNPPPAGKEFRPAGGQTLRQIVAASGKQILFACNGQADGLWAANSVVVANGQITKRTAPGLHAGHFLPLNGTYPFLAFDPHIPGIQDIVFSAGEPLTARRFINGIYGPVLIRDAQRVDDLITQAVPNTGPNQLLWDPAINQAAMSAAGYNEQGQLIFVSLVGDPARNNEPLLADLIDILQNLKAVDAILLGVSGDTQQYVRLADDPWLEARARRGSSLAQMFPDGRPLASAILCQEP